MGGFGVFIFAIPRHVEDNHTNTQAIVVLTGGRERLKTGYQLLKDNRAHMIFISGVHPEENLKSLFKLLETSGVIAREERKPLTPVTHLGFDAENTKENAEETAAWVKKNKVTSLRLVTAAYHMPRSLLELHRLLPQTTIIPHPVFPNGFTPLRWWRYEGAFSLIFSEYNKFLWAFMRMHVPFETHPLTSEREPLMNQIYKILTREEWQKFQKEGVFYGSSLDLKDGFMHCALEDQYPKIREKFLKNQSPVILLSIDPKKLPEGALKIEANKPGGTEYPHLYGSLPLDAVISWKAIS
jgi:uncharacterized protein (DUF952 family)/uncharacterized SAM-binding protein YcdF (DUF218 family)